MELKYYQKVVMNDLSDYLKILNETNDLYSAWQTYWEAKDINVGFGGVPQYNNDIAGVPNVCMKVPTGGGKTFMACAAIKKIMDAMPPNKPRVVVWLVPSDTILEQTIKNLSNINHPYRQRLDMDFGGRVGVYTKDMLLSGQNFSPETVQEMLSVCILSYDSFRINNKEGRKVYKENGNLLNFAEYFKDDNIPLADTPETALIQVLRHLSPVVIVDESHNATSDLSKEMIENLNPSFKLDLTATPRKNSNIISYVDPRELKKEHMVKLPVVVYNRANTSEVIRDAIQLRNSLEIQAKAEENNGGSYIRPIVLFQAQPKNDEDSETFDKIKSRLIDIGIHNDEIAIKTSKLNEIKDIDLMSRKCPIRYIITVDALKEGWDCPFAYILATLANKTSKVAVEQILGRILRQPYTRQNKIPLLNTSYVLTSSNDFHDTLDNIVKGLNNAGFSGKDCRVENSFEEQEESSTEFEPKNDLENEQLNFTLENNESDDIFDEINTEEIRAQLETTDEAQKTIITNMESEAEKIASEYETSINESFNSDHIGGELGDMLNQVEVKPKFKEEIAELRIPQFFIKTTHDFFGGDFELLEYEHLTEGFSLNNQDSNISFEMSDGEMYSVDIQEEGEAVPQCFRLDQETNEYFKKQISGMSREKKCKKCAERISSQINTNNRLEQSEIEDYVKRIISNMSEDEISSMEENVEVYAKKIRDKIDSLEKIYCEEQFYKLIDSGKIVCRESYTLPRVITPSKSTNVIPNSLYNSENDDINGFEREVIDIIASMGNVKWWHRIIDNRGSKDFHLNAFINHYPDFMIMTNSGKLILLETKGGHLDGENSKKKLDLGCRWNYLSGENFLYFMVFKDSGIEGSYTLNEFINIFKTL